ncbi:MAG: hypothetical protein SVZ03_10425 [Spirochaetota bacterium]|nr:hypothetical protein [Spirochaetota bacterium]
MKSIRSKQPDRANIIVKNILEYLRYSPTVSLEGGCQSSLSLAAKSNRFVLKNWENMNKTRRVNGNNLR